MPKKRYNNVIVSLSCRLMAPFIFIFALYVLMHGHYSPGGGFQGGAIFAAGVILLRVSLGRERSEKVFPVYLAPIIGAIGLIIYTGTGLFGVFLGGSFLDYSYLPIPGLLESELRYNGILFVEIGVALGVAGILLSIFDSLNTE